MRVFVIAGEPSGDLLGGALLAGLRKLDPALQIAGVGTTLSGINLIATIVKMTRVMLLVPVLLVVGLWISRARQPGQALGGIVGPEDAAAQLGVDVVEELAEPLDLVVLLLGNVDPGLVQLLAEGCDQIDAAAKAFDLAAADRRGQHIGAQFDPVGDDGMGRAAQRLHALNGDGRGALALDLVGEEGVGLEGAGALDVDDGNVEAHTGLDREPPLRVVDVARDEGSRRRGHRARLQVPHQLHDHR